MLLQEFTRDIVPIMALIVATFGLLGIYVQIHLAVRAIKSANTSLIQTTAWNRTLATYQLFNYHKNQRDEDLFRELLEKDGIKIEKRINKKELTAITSNKGC